MNVITSVGHRWNPQILVKQSSTVITQRIRIFQIIRSMENDAFNRINVFLILEQKNNKIH